MENSKRLIARHCEAASPQQVNQSLHVHCPWCGFPATLSGDVSPEHVICGRCKHKWNAVVTNEAASPPAPTPKTCLHCGSHLHWVGNCPEVDEGVASPAAPQPTAQQEKCPICGIPLCEHGVHPDDECWECERDGKKAKRKEAVERTRKEMRGK
jgi:hypothetical protein